MGSTRVIPDHSLATPVADYELVEFQSQTGTAYVINPADVDWGDEINWSTVAPEWARANGTTVVLLGSEEARDTILGNPKAGENAIKGLSVYLNSRFWDLTNREVVVVELRNERKTSWPNGARRGSCQCALASVGRRTAVGPFLC